MGISRNLLSKFKPNSDMCFFRRVFSTRKPTFLIEHDYDGITNYSLLSAAAAENNNSWKDHHHHHRISTPAGKYNRLLGSCKEWTLFLSYAEEVKPQHSDLVVVVDKVGDSYLQSWGRLSLWNPTTNRVKTFLPSSLPRAPCRVFYMDTDRFGFGFDPKSQDYKLIWIQKQFFTVAQCYSEAKIELYSLETGSWKQITAPPDADTPSHSIDIYGVRYWATHDSTILSVHINGVHYWATHDSTILSFDFADEKFSRISLPDAPHVRRMIKESCLAEFHGSLALIVPYWEERQKKAFSIEICVWNGKAWNVGPRVAVGDGVARVLGLFENEYLFLQGCTEPELIMVFNCKTGKLENLGIQHGAPDSTTRVGRPGIFPYTVPI